jgi:DNA topoisomerase I
MHEVVICEKPKSSERIAKSISGNSVKKNYKKVSYYEFKKNGKKTTVLTAVGHLYSLIPKNSQETTILDVKWAPIHEIDKKKKYVKNYVDALKKLSKDADRFIHACDYDIEGTLIGFNAIKYACGNESLDNTVRMKFSTLTKEDIIKAYQNPIPLDFNQVDSGIARHVLDFLFGVNISKYLMKSVKESTSRFIKLSAGRVQTPTLSILVDREKEIKKFKPEPYWIIRAILEGNIIANHQKGKIFKKNNAKNSFKKCKGNDAIIEKVEIKKTIKSPPFPFNLGGLQAESYNIFRFSPKKTQNLAQNLYTGGYCSYPRTSSQKLPKTLDYAKILKELSRNSTFKKQINKIKKPYKPKEGLKKDEAHPAIHPTGLLPKELTKDEKKLYELIVYRFITVFGEDAIHETMKANLDIGGEKFSFNRKKTTKKGWMNHYPYLKIVDEDFPAIKGDEKLKVKKIICEEKKTKPPARYNQASLIKELEKRGLGTKATRADIISILYDRKYVEGQKIRVNELGEHLIDTLKKYSKQITSEELTKQFEKELKEIMENKIKKDQVIKEARAEVLSIIDDIEKNKLKIGEELYKAYQDSRIVGKCTCGKDLVIKYSPRFKSSFVGCSGYPDCKASYSLPQGGNVLKTTCEKCGLPLISFGKPRQRSCLDPKCGVDETKVVKEIVGICPQCGNDLLKRKGRYGEFIGCSGFPNCRFTKSIELES